ncbi:MAG: YCF48-related protein [Pseudomonadota bacterium]
MNVTENVERAAKLFPEKEAIIFEGRKIHYGELNRGANRLATACKKSRFVKKEYDVAVSDDENIRAVGYFGAIVHSSDGGKTWIRQQAGTATSLTGVSFVNDKEGWAVGDAGKILAGLDYFCHISS